MKKLIFAGLTFFSSTLIVAVPIGALAMATPISTPNNSATSDAVNQAKLNNLKTRGAAEINRRLASLKNALTLINNNQKLDPSIKTDLNTQINNETFGLNNLKAKLASDTDLASARADVQSIYSEYRVYALIIPKIHLLITSNRETSNDDKLGQLKIKLQTRLDTAKKSGKDVSILQSTLDGMTTKISTAIGLAAAVDEKVAPLQPTDYNTDHTILSGLRDQLKTAHQDNEAAYSDAKTIVAGLK